MNLQIKSGMLLFEFSLTLALIIIFSCMLVAPYQWMSRFLLRAEIDSIMFFFSHMQHRAMIEGKDKDVVFDSEKNIYYEKDSEKNEIHILCEGINFEALEGVKGPPSSPQAAVQKPITFVQNTVTFYKTGIISAGVIYIADIKNNLQYAISNAVSSISCIRLYQYTRDGKWILV